MPLSLHRKAIAYISDDGTTYKITADAAEAVGATTGGVVAAGTEPPYPAGWTPRKACFHSTGLTPNFSRECVIFDPAAFAAITAASTLSVNHLGVTEVLSSSQKFHGEKRKYRNVTSQLT